MGWTDKGNGNRTLATTIPKAGVNNYIYGDDAHTDAATSELAFAGIENETNFQNTFEFEAPEWITGISAVENSNSLTNLKYYNLKFNVTANGEGLPARTGNIVIKYHDQALSLTVNQEAGGTTPTPTGFTLYLNSDTNYSDTIAAIKVDNSSIIPPSSKSILVFTSAIPPSDNPNPVTIELLPLQPTNTSNTFYLSLNTNNTYNDDNIAYNNFSGLPNPLPTGLSAFQYLSANNTIKIKVDRNNTIWGDMIDNVSCGLRFYEPENNIYPIINIYISNLLLVVTWYLNYIFVNRTDCQINDIIVEIATPVICNSVNTLENFGTLIDPYDQLEGSLLLSIKNLDVNTLFTLDPGFNGKGYTTLHIESATGTKPLDLINVTCSNYIYSLNYMDPFYIYIE